MFSASTLRKTKAAVKPPVTVKHYFPLGGSIVFRADIIHERPFVYGPPDRHIWHIHRLHRGAGRAPLAVEGFIAEKYWGSLKDLYAFPGRIPQGRDKFNSAINYGYGILYNEVERACLYTGLDPYLGLYHSERYGKPALVLDLVEEFRVSVVDSVVFPLFLEKKLGKRGDFERVGKNEYRLSAEGKAKVVEAVFGKLNQRVKRKRKQRTVQDIIKEQSQHLARYFLGAEALYIPFELSLLL